ncbi:hypothetical protein MUK72_11935 [Halococcus dombrowskii]|uniref:Uncharacterized protein n=1 Tax=Halococcus dombrowskii TaxID=179637 RepID=A0AAV3SEV5_HALDO|nr:hypothetical protein [Halococcus dombrowskii]UOO94674.1 hypothetical protein MUK72_11935 [Halococcus dombrowskii]
MAIEDVLRPMADIRAPSVPDDRLDGWTMVEETTETLFALPTMRVRGHTLVYEDGPLREALRAADDALDMPWRFFFATRLAFRPPLAPGIGTASVLPTVATELRRSFASDLEDRGFRAVERGRKQRMRTDAGDRARLTKYTARYAVERNGSDRDDGDHDIAIEGWVAVWTRRSGFRIAGGAYPIQGFAVLCESAGIDLDDPNAYREELLGLLRAVE